MSVLAHLISKKTSLWIKLLSSRCSFCVAVFPFFLFFLNLSLRIRAHLSSQTPRWRPLQLLAPLPRARVNCSPPGKQDFSSLKSVRPSRSWHCGRVKNQGFFFFFCCSSHTVCRLSQIPRRFCVWNENVTGRDVKSQSLLDSVLTWNKGINLWSNYTSNVFFCFIIPPQPPPPPADNEHELVSATQANQ